MSLSVLSEVFSKLPGLFALRLFDDIFDKKCRPSGAYSLSIIIGGGLEIGPSSIKSYSETPIDLYVTRLAGYMVPRRCP